MPAPRPSFDRLRFGFALDRDRALDRDCDRARRAFGPPRDVPEQRMPAEHMLDVPRAEGLELLDWLGLGRPDFGAIPARELAPRCRRRLWNVERNADASLRARTCELLAVAEAAGDGVVLFG